MEIHLKRDPFLNYQYVENTLSKTAGNWMPIKLSKTGRYLLRNVNKCPL